MQSSKKLFLSTGMSQIDTAKFIVKKLQHSVDYLTYNIKRYKVPVSLVLFYSEEDITALLTQYMRLTDALKVIKIGDSYFNFIFLPFTEVEESYSFIIKEEHHKLKKIEHLYYFDTLPPEVHNYYNLINSYLFKILEEKNKIL